MSGTIRPFYLLANTVGIDQSTSPFEIDDHSAELIENMHVDRQGTFSAHLQGYTTLLDNSDFSQSIANLIRYRNAYDASKYFTIEGTTLKQLNLAQATVGATIGSGFTTVGDIDYAQVNDQLFMVNAGFNPKKLLPNLTVENATAFPITLGEETFEKPVLVERYGNRLIYADFRGATAYPSHIALSADLDPEGFEFGLNDTDAALIQVSPGDGQAITAIKSLHIPFTNETVLLIFKTESIYLLSGDSPATFAITQLNDGIGAMNNRAMVQVGSDIIFLYKDNIYALSTANNSGSIQFKAIHSDRIKQTLSTINLAAKDKALAIHLPSRQEVWFAIPTGSSQVADVVLVYHYSLSADESSVWTIKTGVNYKDLLLGDQDELYGVINTNEVARFFTSSLYGAAATPWMYRYPYLDFRTPVALKRVLDCTVWFLLYSPFELSITTEWRGSKGRVTKTITKTVEPSAGGALYGTDSLIAAHYGQSIYNDASLVPVKIPVWGNGTQLRFQLSGNTTALGGPIFLGISGLYELMSYSRDVL